MSNHVKSWVADKKS